MIVTIMPFLSFGYSVVWTTCSARATRNSAMVIRMMERAKKLRFARAYNTFISGLRKDSSTLVSIVD